MSDRVLELEDLSCRYGRGAGALVVFEGLNLQLDAGDAAALVGPSGCGKSSLLHMAGLLDRPSGGDVKINGRVCDGLTDQEISAIRMKEIGFVFQFHHLLPEFSALDNVALASLIAGKSFAKSRARAGELLEEMGLSDRASHRPSELSGGERQRVAIARALANRPRLLLADEPTGNLDPATAKRVFSSFLDLVDSSGSDSQPCAVLVATHNMELAQMMGRVLDLTQGVLRQEPNKSRLRHNKC